MSTRSNRSFFRWFKNPGTVFGPDNTTSANTVAVQDEALQFTRQPRAHIISGLATDGDRESRFYQAYRSLYPQVIASVEKGYVAEYKEAICSQMKSSSDEDALVAIEAIDGLVARSVPVDLFDALFPKVSEPVSLTADELWDLTKTKVVLNKLHQAITGQCQKSHNERYAKQRFVVDDSLLSSLPSSPRDVQLKELVKQQHVTSMLTQFEEKPDAVATPLLFEFSAEEKAVSVFLTANEMTQLKRNNCRNENGSILKAQITQILGAIDLNPESGDSGAQQVKSLFSPGTCVNVCIRAFPNERIFNRLSSNGDSLITCTTELPTSFAFLSAGSSGDSSLVEQLDGIGSSLQSTRP